MSFVRTLIDLFRGAFIGVAEILPGVSGGTIALIVGVYEILIDSAGNLVRGIVRAVVDLPRGRGLGRAGEHFAAVQWRVLLPIGIGMMAAILVGARIVAPLVEDHPVFARALFAGLILVSLAVPARMVGGRWTRREWAVAGVAGLTSFLLTGLPAFDPSDPPLWLVSMAAAFAVCALVLPGVSGSFILVTVGLYEPTLAALNERDLGYVGVFMLGAILGLGLFVQVLRWLLMHRRRITLALMTGLMAGSLRSLWPWQGEDNELLAPGEDVLAVLGFFVIGMVSVAMLLAVESFLVRRRLTSGEDTLHPTEHAEGQ
ncbi:DUF368 domain-containing protein [Aeromicrobium sp. CTD01-1L150]|uniref:DUF368 domain-containing protein n=1 Tax=Aeromicrobium sp. CTD01-1L150 TaxID=3341830 RepID=UPI0035C0144B